HFEIQADDLDRAQKFYEAMLDDKLQAFPGGEPCLMFPTGDGGVGGCIMQRATEKPSPDGTVVYINVDGKLDASLKRAEKLGTKILVPRTEIPGGYGFFACVEDSEGNHVGLHSRQF
ncbi:MAG: VOC family protein, partial [Acidobacteriota bacterium]